MENEIKDNKYFIIWLYISILLHLFVVIIMLSIKSATPVSQDPDPASGNPPSHVIFMQDKPDPIAPAPDYKIATRIQGGQIGMQADQATQKEPVLDIPAPSLSDDYKKGLVNQTNNPDQDSQGQVAIQPDAIIADQAQKEQPKFDTTSDNVDNKDSVTAQSIQIAAADALKAIMQQKTIKEAIEFAASKKQEQVIDQPQEQKIISQKHRPAEIGSENLSKVQLSKQTQDTGSQKNKLSLMDIQKGFSQFIQNNKVVAAAPATSSTLGNSLYFSSTGNSDKDDISGLKFASYMNQAGKMYQSSSSEYMDAIHKIMIKEGVPSENNQIAITIDRSGKVVACVTTLSCGHQMIDNYHIKIIESIGSFPPIPKYIQAPLQVHAQLPFKNIKISNVRRTVY